MWYRVQTIIGTSFRYGLNTIGTFTMGSSIVWQPKNYHWIQAWLLEQRIFNTGKRHELRKHFMELKELILDSDMVSWSKNYQILIWYRNQRIVITGLKHGLGTKEFQLRSGLVSGPKNHYHCVQAWSEKYYHCHLGEKLNGNQRIIINGFRHFLKTKEL